MTERIVMDLFEAEYGRPMQDTDELIKFVLDLRERHGWAMLEEILQ
jgi:hypothetical protein